MARYLIHVAALCALACYAVAVTIPMDGEAIPFPPGDGSVTPPPPICAKAEECLRSVVLGGQCAFLPTNEGSPCQLGAGMCRQGRCDAPSPSPPLTAPAVCAPNSCPAGQDCHIVDGRLSCWRSACSNLVCGNGFKCVDLAPGTAKCVPRNGIPDMCHGLACPEDLQCTSVNGVAACCKKACSASRHCADVACPKDSHCAIIKDYAMCVASWPDASNATCPDGPCRAGFQCTPIPNVGHRCVLGRCQDDYCANAGHNLMCMSSGIDTLCCSKPKPASCATTTCPPAFHCEENYGKPTCVPDVQPPPSPTRPPAPPSHPSPSPSPAPPVVNDDDDDSNHDHHDDSSDDDDDDSNHDHHDDSSDDDDDDSSDDDDDSSDDDDDAHHKRSDDENARQLRNAELHARLADNRFMR